MLRWSPRRPWPTAPRCPPPPERRAVPLLPDPLPATGGALVDALARRHLGRGPTARERSVLLELAATTADAPVRATDEWVRAAAPALVHTLLNSPGHMER